MAKLSEARTEELRQLVGDPASVAEDLARLQQAAKALSSDRPRFIEKYPQKWVAVLADSVVVATDSLSSLLDALDARGIPRQQAIVRFIDTEDRTLFL